MCPLSTCKEQPPAPLPAPGTACVLPQSLPKMQEGRGGRELLGAAAASQLLLISGQVRLWVLQHPVPGYPAVRPGCGAAALSHQALLLTVLPHGR